MRKKISTQKEAGEAAPSKTALQFSNPCPTCSIYADQVIYLRKRVEDLEAKLLCMVPEASQSYQRMRLAEVTAARPEVSDGLMPLTGTIDDEDKAFTEWVEGFKRGNIL